MAKGKGGEIMTDQRTIAQLKAALHAVIDAYNAPRHMAIYHAIDCMGMSDVRESRIREQVNNGTNLLLDLYEREQEERNERAAG